MISMSRNDDTDALAICDEKAWIHHPESKFIQFIRNEWPGWSGPVLPEPVKKWLEKKEITFLKLEKIVLQRTNLNDMVLIKARLRGIMAYLTQREEEVAESFALGLTYKEIANELVVSPNTIRRHIESIYKKLGVASKVELFQMIRPHSS
jgi:DNA-binding NarL/FixJ family response regulator